LESRRLLPAGSYSSLLDTKEGRLKPAFAANVDISFARAGSQRGFFSRRIGRASVGGVRGREDLSRPAGREN